jgi:Ca-activated chloride channel family protein
VKRDWCKTRTGHWLAKTRPIACLVALCAAIPVFAQDTTPPDPPEITVPPPIMATPASDEVPKPPTNNARNTPSVIIKPGKVIKAEVDLALVNVTVTDPYNRLVTGLEPDNFRVFEDNIEQ